VKKFSLKTLLLRIADACTCVACTGYAGTGVIEMEIPEAEHRKNDFIVRKRKGVL